MPMATAATTTRSKAAIQTVRDRFEAAGAGRAGYPAAGGDCVTTAVAGNTVVASGAVTTGPGSTTVRSMSLPAASRRSCSAAASAVIRLVASLAVIARR